MSTWKEKHYDRVQEFLALLADAVSTRAAPVSSVQNSASAASPTPSPPTVQVEAPGAPAASPTAATVFKKIPWGKK